MRFCKVVEVQTCVFPHRSLDVADNTVHSWDFLAVDIVVLEGELLMLKWFAIFHTRLGRILEACYPLAYREVVCRSTLPIRWGRVVTFEGRSF